MASSTGGPAIDWQFGSPRLPCARSQTYQASCFPRLSDMDAEMPAASAAHRASLEQSRAFARRRCARQFVATAVGLEQSEILLISLPTDVAGMGVRNAGQPIAVVVLSLDRLLAVGCSPVPATSIRVGSRVSWIVSICASPSMRSAAGRRYARRGGEMGNQGPSFRNTFTVWLAEPTRENVSKK